MPREMLTEHAICNIQMTPRSIWLHYVDPFFDFFKCCNIDGGDNFNQSYNFQFTISNFQSMRQCLNFQPFGNWNIENYLKIAKLRIGNLSNYLKFFFSISLILINRRTWRCSLANSTPSQSNTISLASCSFTQSAARISTLAFSCSRD